MLSAALGFFVLALLAAWLGFGALSGLAATIAKICAIIFVVIFVISLVRGRAG